MASVYRMDGMEWAVGLQGCKSCDEAIQIAQSSADELGEDVELIDDDGRWIVHPKVDGIREAADPVEADDDDESDPVTS